MSICPMAMVWRVRGGFRLQQTEQDGKTRDRTAQKDGRPDMKMNLTLNS